MNYIFPGPDLNALDPKDTRLLTLLPDKLQSRLRGCLIDIDDLEIGTQIGKGIYEVISANDDVIRIIIQKNRNFIYYIIHISQVHVDNCL